MGKVSSILVAVALLASLGIASAGCAPETEPEVAETGTVEVRVTDAPRKDEVTSIMVTALQVEIHKAVAEQEQQQTQGADNQTQEQQQVQEDGGEWLSIDIIETARSFDLLKLVGIEELLATSNVEAGKYTQIRLNVEKVEVALGDGGLEPATLPSGELKFVRPFDVVAGETTIVIIDFDAEKSVTVTGAGKVLVRPVVKLIVEHEGSVSEDGGVRVVSQEESQQIAEEFVRNSPTFVFDGIEDSLVLADTLTQGESYSGQFVFEFESSQAGYGNRTGQMLAQVITPHRAVITVAEGEVTSAVMDDKWDMIEQKELDEQEAETGEATSVEVGCDEFIGTDETGRDVLVPVDGSLLVVLCSNPTTGFEWELAEISDETVVELVDSEYEPGKKAKQDPPVPGAGGTEIWSFKALKTGEATISMEYNQPWEGGEKATWTFNLTIVVE